MTKKLLIALSLFLGGYSAMAANLEDSQLKELESNSYQFVSKASGTSAAAIALNIQYAGAATEAYVQVAHSSMTFYAPNNIADTAFAGGSGSGVLNLGFSTTVLMGQVCGLIDAKADWKCKLIGAYGTEASSFTRNAPITYGENNAKLDVGFDVQFDSGSALMTPASPHIPLDVRLGIVPQSGKRVRLKQCVTRAADEGPVVAVFGKLAKNASRSDIDMKVSTTNAVAFISRTTGTAVDNNITSDFTLSGVVGIDFAKDERVVITNSLKGVLVQRSDSFVECWWEEK